MVNAKAHRARSEIRKICDDGDHFVPARLPEDQVVRRVVNNHVVGMIAESADAKSNEQTQPPITKAQLAHPECDRRLHNQDRSCNKRGPRIAHHQLANFWMRSNDGPGTPRMRLLRFGLVKRGLHYSANYCIAPTSSIAL